ncbi:MAG TPA: 4-alpha-glucanotransferase, partial [Streptomyces sp.]|nr:4-alpha-glucanotransferase [Streptomyces sp.]
MGRLARLAAAHGVCTSYDPAPGHTIQVPDHTIVEVLAALGVDASTPESVRKALERHADEEATRLLPPTVVVRAPHPPGPPGSSAREPVPPRPTAPLTSAIPSAVRGALPPLPGGTVLRVETEDGRSLEWESGRPEPGPADGHRELPLGCHTLYAQAPDGRIAHSTLIVAPDRFPALDGRCHG